MRESARFVLAGAPAELALVEPPAPLSGLRINADVVLTYATAAPIEAVEAKPRAEAAPRIVGRLLQTRATLAAVMA
jgi:hypothetical protein